MMKVLLLALTTLVLSVCPAFAEPPNPVVAGDTSGMDNYGLGQLSDADMAAVTGAAWWSGACTVGTKAGGYVLAVLGAMLGDPIGQGIGLGIVAHAAAICT